jgi:hypothetical protein
VPKGWFIWAAGNRKEDRAAVFEMPAPLANRFLHLNVEPDLDSFKDYAFAHGLHEQIVAFLSFRPSLLHKVDPQQVAWPSPRSWEMANTLHKNGLDTASAVGPGTASEFGAYISIYTKLPDLNLILKAKGADIVFPDEPSLRYAIITGLTLRAEDAEEAYQAFAWITARAPLEWVQLFAIDAFRLMRAKGQMLKLQRLIRADPVVMQTVVQYQDLMNPAPPIPVNEAQS